MKDDPQQEQEIASAWREAVTHEAPPPALDATIRAAARATPAAPAAARRRPRYLAPLALAASVVVAVGLVLRQQPVETTPSVAPAPAASRQAEPAKRAARAEAPPAPATTDSSASEEEARAPQAVAPPPPAAAAQSSPSPPTSPSPSMFTRERRAETLHDLEAAAGAAARDAAPDVVTAIRALLARGERDAAAALAREYVARRPSPPPLPADLRFLLDDG